MASQPNRNMLFLIPPIICGITAFILFHLKPRTTSSSSSSSATCPPDSASPPSSSVDHPEIKYDVFLSFRGTDTRSGFLSHLLEELKRKKIDYFADDQKIKRGDEIKTTLLSAIKLSQISLVVFSKDYADSKWCLEELEQILHCRENQKQIVIPVFYKVDPSIVRHQKGSYKNALDKLGKRFGNHKQQKWQISLKKAANLSGFDSSKYPTEEILIKEIVEHVSEELRKMGNKIDLEGFVVIQNHIEDLEKLLHTESQDIFIIGLWGMGGVGKTTIAEILYNKLQLHNKYDDKHFLCVKEGLEIHGDIKKLRRDLLSKLLSEKEENFDYVPPHSIPEWVKRRLNRKKILLVLDDINESDQLKILTGGHEWFGLGSRIIMTSRDKHLFSSKCDKIYEVKPLNPEDAFQLFEKTLTEKCRVRKEKRYELSKKVLNYAQGVPLAIRVLGLYLCDKDKKEWESKLEKLEKEPHWEIQNVLELSYIGLGDNQHKDIFLYLACFFRNESKELIIKLLDACGYQIIDGLRVLQDKALINISNEGFVSMHDLIRDMGREIVRKISPKDPGQRSHLWDANDICEVFMYQLGTQTVESIRLNTLELEKDLQIGSQAFVRMNYLKLLHFHLRVHPPEEGFESLPKELRYFYWYMYPLESFPLRCRVNNLTELHFPSSKLKRLWDGVQELPSLKVINFSFSFKLIELPNLSRASKLEYVDLSNCKGLFYVPLWPRDAWESDENGHLHFLPTSAYALPSLQHLDLSYCDNISFGLPDNIDHYLPSLHTLSLVMTKFKALPKGITYTS